nr:MAG TPA: nucelotide kinase [Caudoviricetes sp.]
MDRLRGETTSRTARPPIRATAKSAGLDLSLPAEEAAVNHPAHYATYDPEVITITERLNFCAGNVVKYLARAGRKPGAPEQLDRDKARWYMRRIAYNEDGTFNRDALTCATGTILGTIAALTPATARPWQDVFDAVIALSNEIESNA